MAAIAMAMCSKIHSLIRKKNHYILPMISCKRNNEIVMIMTWKFHIKRTHDNNMKFHVFNYHGMLPYEMFTFHRLHHINILLKCYGKDVKWL